MLFFRCFFVVFLSLVVLLDFCCGFCVFVVVIASVMSIVCWICVLDHSARLRHTDCLLSVLFNNRNNCYFSFALANAAAMLLVLLPSLFSQSAFMFDFLRLLFYFHGIVMRARSLSLSVARFRMLFAKQLLSYLHMYTLQSFDLFKMRKKRASSKFIPFPNTFRKNYSYSVWVCMCLCVPRTGKTIQWIFECCC